MHIHNFWFCVKYILKDCSASQEVTGNTVIFINIFLILGKLLGWHITVKDLGESGSFFLSLKWVCHVWSSAFVKDLRCAYVKKSSSLMMLVFSEGKQDELMWYSLM